MAKFNWGSEIGSGGFGRVRRASFAEPTSGFAPNAELAAKFLKDEYAGDEEAVRRFTGEVRILQKLEHPNIVKVIGRNLSADPPWFVMPYAASNLHKEIHENGRAGEREWIVATFRAILDAMAYAHGQDVIHRDLKPDNVLFVEDVPVVSDFGLGRRLDSESSRLTMSAAAMGTLAYMAPEQFGDVKHCGPQADVYALGKILWEMLSGQAPQPLASPDLGEIPGEFRHFVSRCCENDAQDRYPDASEALAAFEVLTASSPLSDSDPPLQVAERLVQEWSQTPEGADRDVLERFDDHLTRYADEEELYFELVPRLPRNLLEQYMEVLPGAFAEMLVHYDGHVSGGLPFSYCDVLSDFYEFLFPRVGNVRTKRMIIARLLDVGASHNRWHVGRALTRMLESIEDEGTDEVAAEAIRGDPDHAQWFLPYLEAAKLPRRAAGAIQQVAAEREARLTGASESGFVPF